MILHFLGLCAVMIVLRSDPAFLRVAHAFLRVAHAFLRVDPTFLRVTFLRVTFLRVAHALVVAVEHVTPRSAFERIR